MNYYEKNELLFGNLFEQSKIINKNKIKSLPHINNPKKFKYSRINHFNRSLNLSDKTKKIDKTTENLLKKMFVKVSKHYPHKNNFININYLLYKICELLTPEHCNKLKLPKGENNDKIWKLLCDKNGWKFIESI